MDVCLCLECSEISLALSSLPPLGCTRGESCFTSQMSKQSPNLYLAACKKTAKHPGFKGEAIITFDKFSCHKKTESHGGSNYHC